MSADLAIGVKVGFSAGAAIAGLTSIRRSIGNLAEQTHKLSARQRLLASVLANPLHMTKSRVGELKREYVELGRTIDQIRNKSAQLANIAHRRQNLANQRQELMGQVASVASLSATAVIPVKLAMDFESAMSGVRKVVDFDTPQQFQEMQSDILALTRTIPLSAKELAQITASGGQLGVARQDLMSFTETIAKMSVAFDMSAEEAGSSMAQLANVFQMPMSKIGELGDAINHLSNANPARANQIVQVLGRAGSVGKDFGLNPNQMAALSTAFISLGRSPEVAGTAINGMLTRLTTADKQGRRFQNALKGMGLSAQQLKRDIAQNGEQALMNFLTAVERLPKEQRTGALVDLFGLEYADDVAALVGGLDTYRQAVDALKETNASGSPKFIGSMGREFDAVSQTTTANWQKLKSGLVELAIVAGSTLLPVINDLFDGLRPMIYALTDWASANPQIIRGIIGFVAGLALFKVALLSSAFAINILLSGLLFFPAGIAKVSSTWLMAALKFKSGSGVIFQVVQAIKSGWGLMTRVGGTLIRFLPMLGQAFMALGRFLLMTPIGLALGLMAAAAYLLYTRWDGVVGGAKLLWQDLSAFVGSIANAITGFFSNAWAQIQAAFNSGLTGISALILNWSPIGAFYSAFAAVMSWFGVTLPAQFTAFGSMLIDGLVNGIKAKIGNAVAAVQGLAERVKGAFTGSGKGMDIHSPSRVFRSYGGFITEGLAIGVNKGASKPVGRISQLAGNLKSRFAERMGQLRSDIAARVSGSSADFAAARAQQAAPVSAAASGALTVHFSPTIHAPGGDPAQIQTAVQMGLREFEQLFNRLMADHERRSY